jgi:hypothetical protein
MDPTPYLIMGTLIGITATLAIQWFANRKVRKALSIVQNVAAPSEEMLLQQREAAEMRRRLIVLEKIVTDQPQRLAHEIDGLR